MNPDLTMEDLQALWKKGQPEESDVLALLARVPPSWTMYSRALFGAEDGACFKRGTIQVISCGRTGETRFYLPGWEDMKRVKHDFIGEDAWAYQVFPSAKDYINQHPYVLHLFARFDGRPALPDFTRGTGSI